MILVLCLNAAVDKTCRLRRIASPGMNRLGAVLAIPGGKGINAARVLKSLGQAPLVLGFTAGHGGGFIEEGLRREGIAARWIRLRSGESRVCLSILHGRDVPTEFNEAGPAVRPGELSRLTSLYRRWLGRASLVVISGSLPRGCPADLYARLIRLADGAGKPVFLDSSGEALALAVAAGPDLVKLNSDEAASLGLDMGNPARALRRLVGKGPRDAVITLGSRGAVASLGGRFLRVSPPRTRILSPVGCGDTFLAALAHARLEALSSERALALAAARGPARARIRGARGDRRRDVPRVLRGTRLSPL